MVPNGGVLAAGIKTSVQSPFGWVRFFRSVLKPLVPVRMFFSANPPPSSVTAPVRAICSWVAAVLMAIPSRADVVPVWPEDLAGPRRELLTKALAFLKAHPAVPYVEGGASAAGMDCSGATTALLKQVGIVPPRSSHGQYEWLRESGRLTLVPAAARTPDDPVFRTLQPGDLIFWAHDKPGDEFRVSHVHMYLGEEKDGHAVMIGSSDGRSYRGKKLSGFGIVDYHVPKAGSATRIVGFGSPFPVVTGTSTEPRKPTPSQSLRTQP